MGFRSTFVTEHYYVEKWPKWFIDKYKDSINFNDASTCISSKAEDKTYGIWADLDTDIQKAINKELKSIEGIVLIYLHECGGITRVKIMEDEILYSEPREYRKVDCIEHNYCYGCSDIIQNEEGQENE